MEHAEYHVAVNRGFLRDGQLSEPTGVLHGIASSQGGQPDAAVRVYTRKGRFKRQLLGATVLALTPYAFSRA
jgi:hypothetical protein